jgi:carbon-monoxide dehydrogenase medium subunit
MNAFELEVPTSREQVLALLAEHGDEAKLMAGGTGLINLMKQRLVFPERLISLHQVPGLDAIIDEADSLRIGASVRLSDLERHPYVTTGWPMLGQALAEVASPRVRAMATIGGALAHGDPHQDTPAALMALGARVKLESGSGTREVALDGFYLDYYETQLKPDELITEVVVPRPAPLSAATYVKYLPRSAEDYATVAVAVNLTLAPGSGDAQASLCQRCTIVLGSMGSTPIRSPDADALVAGSPLSWASFQAAGERASHDTDPLSDTRGSASYKRDMAAVFVRRALVETAAKLGLTIDAPRV